MNKDDAIACPQGRLERTEALLVGYRTARDLLAKARRGLERYKREPLSVDGTDMLMDLIVTVHSLTDWVYEHHFQPRDAARRERSRFDYWRTEQANNCPDIEVLEELANAFKHRALDRDGDLKVQILKAGTIVYEIEPRFEQALAKQLATFGQVQQVAMAVSDDEIELPRYRHTAHIVRIHTEQAIDWSYAVDVVNRALTYWERLIDEHEEGQGQPAD